MPAIRDGSVVIGIFGWLRRQLSPRIGRLSNGVNRAITGSALYRWLTAEPDPEVIVIDLRETRTLGPVLRVLDRVIHMFVGAAAGSRVVERGRDGYAVVRRAPVRTAGFGLVAVGVVHTVVVAFGGATVWDIVVGLTLLVVGLAAMQETRDWAALWETRPVRLVIAALEPPEPPAETTDSDDGCQAADRDADPEPPRGRS